MGIDDDFDDTILHISGNILKEEVNDQVADFVEVRYIRPGTKAG
jgi:hypothetical protein